MEAVAFACLLALVHVSGGLDPLALTPTTLAIVGATLVLVAVLRETGSEARGTAVVGATLGTGVLLAVVLPTHPLDVVTWGGRIIAFVIVAEVYLWRVVSLARGSVRWPSPLRRSRPSPSTERRSCRSRSSSWRRRPSPSRSRARPRSCL